MEPSTRESGKKTSSRAKVKSSGLMEPNSREPMCKAKRTDKENSFGVMGVLMKENSMTTILKGLVLTLGLTRDSMLELGKTIRWTGRGCFPGLMGGSMRESI